VGEFRATVVWLVAGILGMAGLLLVMRFGVAVGLAMIVAFSTPTLAGSALRWQAVALSGLMTGFGMLWLLFVAGEAIGGVSLHGSVAGHVLFGLVVLALGTLLGLWHLSSSGRQVQAPSGPLAAGQRPSYWPRRLAAGERPASWPVRSVGRSSGAPYGLRLMSRAGRPVPVELRVSDAAYRRPRPPA